jgi:hypothetical protein
LQGDRATQEICIMQHNEEVVQFGIRELRRYINAIIITIIIHFFYNGTSATTSFSHIKLNNSKLNLTNKNIISQLT